jgi:alpha-tubulin suppressor-like RCC1 family protein
MAKIKVCRFFPVMMALVLIASLGAAILPASPVKAISSTPIVAAGYHHTVGLKSDGTMVAMGDNTYGQCNVGSWTGIIQVAAGGRLR